MPGSVKLVYQSSATLAVAFGIGAVFLLIVLFFAPGPIMVNGVAMDPQEFKGIGVGVLAACLLISLLQAAVFLGIRSRKPWFRTAEMAFVVLIMLGGVVANVVASRPDLALASGALAVPVIGTAWYFLYRSSGIWKYLEASPEQAT